jgi:hypothetical protein
VLNRAFAADRWLVANLGISVKQASGQQLTLYLETLTPHDRETTWEALCAYGDDLVRKGIVEQNSARTIRLPA